MNITRVNAIAKPGIIVDGEVMILGLRDRGPFKVTGITGPWIEIENPITGKRGEMHTDELTAA